MKEIEKTGQQVQKTKFADLLRTFWNKGRNAELNTGVGLSRLTTAFSMIQKKEDSERLKMIIAEGNFEVEKMELAYNQPLKKYLDRKTRFKSIQESINADLPTLATIMKYKGEEAAVQVASQIILNFVSKYETSNMISPELISELANEFLFEFPALKISEYKFAFSQAIKETNYNRVDYNVVYKIIQDYSDRRDAKTGEDSFYNHIGEKEGEGERSKSLISKNLRLETMALVNPTREPTADQKAANNKKMQQHCKNK